MADVNNMDLGTTSLQNRFLKMPLLFLQLITSAEFDLESIQTLRKSGMTWTAIANAVGISRKQLYTFRKTFMDEPVIDDASLSDEIVAIKEENPQFGEVYVKAALISRGYEVTRARIRRCLHTIDEQGIQDRMRRRIHRRRYGVAGPNYLWHLDGNEKLQRFKIYIHGCTDGYSRKVMYMKCTKDKLSTTTLKIFHEAVLQFGLPYRIRCDLGGENVKIQDFMTSNLGNDHNCVLVGPSVHNIRIERLWREINMITAPFKLFFYQMVSDGLLDVTDDFQLFSFHYIYLPRIQKKLDDFVLVWDCHKIRTAQYKSPDEMYLTGVKAPEYDVRHPPQYFYNADEEDMERNLDGMNAFASEIINDPLEDDGYDGIALYQHLVQSFYDYVNEM